MQSSELAIQRKDSATTAGWLERLSLLEKAPLAFLFGAILAMSSPGFDHSWLAWVALAPLLVLTRGSNSKLEATMVGLFYGFAYYLVASSWYLGLFPLRWLGVPNWVAVQAVGLVWALESLHEALLFAAFSWLIFSLPLRAGFLPHWRRPFYPYVLSIPLIWVFFHWVVATSEPFLGMPVNQLAYSQHQHLELIQMASLAGSGMIDFMLVMSNCVVAAVIFEMLPLAQRLSDRTDQIAPKMGAWVDISLVACIVGGFMFWGSFNIQQIAWQTRPENEDHMMQQSPAIPIAVLQANTSIEEEKMGLTSPRDIANRYTQMGTATGALMLFLPEGAGDPSQFKPGMLFSKLKGIALTEKKEVVVGTVEKVHDDSISTARIIAPTPPPDSAYVKQRLVPFGEAAPLGMLGEVAAQLTATVAGNKSEHFASLHSPSLLGSMFGKIGVSISNDLIFPNLIAAEVRRGAHLLVNLTNLNRFHSSSLNKQFVAVATLRAVENGRFLVMATNTGISAVIDPAGVVTTMAYPGRRGVIMDTVQFLYNKTPYTKMSKMWWL